MAQLDFCGRLSLKDARNGGAARGWRCFWLSRSAGALLTCAVACSSANSGIELGIHSTSQPPVRQHPGESALTCFGNSRLNQANGVECMTATHAMKSLAAFDRSDSFQPPRNGWRCMETLRGGSSEDDDEVCPLRSCMQSRKY